MPISTGSDYETPPDDPFPALHQELYFLHERCGMPAAEVLRSATQVGARSAGAEDDMGTLEPGKLANFVVLDRDPLADLRNLDSIWCTVKRGPDTPARLPEEEPMTAACRSSTRSGSSTTRTPRTRSPRRASSTRAATSSRSTSAPCPTPTPPGSPRSTSPSATRWARWSRTPHTLREIETWDRIVAEHPADLVKVLASADIDRARADRQDRHHLRLPERRRRRGRPRPRR